MQVDSRANCFERFGDIIDVKLEKFFARWGTGKFHKFKKLKKKKKLNYILLIFRDSKTSYFGHFYIIMDSGDTWLWGF